MHFAKTWRESHHPGRSSKEASRLFLIVAATPPHEEGNRLNATNGQTLTRGHKPRLRSEDYRK
jgi:hypothetical protein